MKTVYLSYVAGIACIREMGTDSILHTFKGKRSYEQHLASALPIVKKYGWELR